MSGSKRIVKWHGQMELSYISPNQNHIPILGLRETLAPKEEASKVSLQGHAQVHPKGLVGSGGRREKS
jgi:hypothetical protein